MEKIMVLLSIANKLMKMKSFPHRVFFFLQEGPTVESRSGAGPSFSSFLSRPHYYYEQCSTPAAAAFVPSPLFWGVENGTFLVIHERFSRIIGGPRDVCSWLICDPVSAWFRPSVHPYCVNLALSNVHKKSPLVFRGNRCVA